MNALMEPKKMISSILVGLAMLIFPLSGRSGLTVEAVGRGEDGIHGTIADIGQDPFGYLWIATDSGLARYDGYRFRFYQNDPQNPRSLYDNDIQSIHFDRKGQLWVGTSHGCLHRFSSTTGEFIRYPLRTDPRSDSDDFIFRILEDRNGQIWLATLRSGLLRFEEKTGRFGQVGDWGVASGDQPPIMVMTLAEARDGSLWIGTWGDGLARVDPKTQTFTRFHSRSQDKNSLSCNFISDLKLDDDGTLWIATGGGGLNRLQNRGSEWEFKKFLHDPNSPTSIGSDVLTRMILAPDGQIWIGTMGGGLSVFDRKTQVFANSIHDPDKRFSLSSDEVNTIFRDKSGIFWIGTTSGLDKHVPGKVKFDTHRLGSVDTESLLEANITALFKDRAGVVWIGTASGWVTRLERRDRQWSHFPIPSPRLLSPEARTISSIFQDREGGIWIGAGDGRLLHLDPQSGRPIGSVIRIEGTADQKIVHISEDTQGNLWVGITNGGIARIDRPSFRITTFERLPAHGTNSQPNAVICMQGDQHGYFWIGATTGLDRFDPATGKVRHFSEEEGFPAEARGFPITAMRTAGKSTMWLASSHGLIRHELGTNIFTNIRRRFHLPPILIYALEVDDRGHLWLGTHSHGLFRLDPATGDCLQFSIENGLQSLVFHIGASFKSIDGEMLFGGDKGFSTFYPDRLIMDHRPPIITVSSIRGRSGSTLIEPHGPPIESVSLNKRDFPVTIEFSALQFADPAKNRYAWRWRGKNWSSPSFDPWINLPRLSAGLHTLQIRACHADGVWNETGINLLIRIRSPFWSTPWFYLTGIGLIFSAAILLRSFWKKSMKQVILDPSIDLEPIRYKYNISKREEEIIRLVLQGKTNKEIEDLLFISYQTVKTHLYRIYKKMSVKNRLQLIQVISSRLHK